MRVDPTTFAAHRAAILRQASRLFRRRGLGGVGVAEISRAAGLTHGAFYGHYPSKAALAALGPELCRAEPPLPETLGQGVAALAAALQDEIALSHPTLDATACRLWRMVIRSTPARLDITWSSRPGATRTTAGRWWRGC